VKVHFCFDENNQSIRIRFRSSKQSIDRILSHSCVLHDIVEPHVVVTLNGTFSTPQPITFDCSAIYSQDFGNSLKDLVIRINNAISRGQLCATTQSVTSIPGDVKLLVDVNMVSRLSDTRNASETIG